MDTELIVAELKRLKKRVYDAARYLLTILVIPKEGSIARINVQNSRLSGKRLGFVHIAENLLQLIHHLLIFVVLWNVGRQDLKHQIGHCLKNFLGNVFNVVKNSGNSYRKLRNLAVNFVLVNVKLILRNIQFLLRQIFTGLVNGIKQGEGFLNETIRPAKNVVSMESIFTFIIRNSNGTGEKKMMKTSLFSVCDVT